jgi:hypothetical protein
MAEENLSGNKSKIEILGYHAEYERNLGRLYSLFSKKFPETDIWSYLVEEERKHEAWVKQIIFKFNEGVIKFESESDYSRWVCDCVINLKNKIEEIEKSEITLKEALIISLDYEDNMLEKEFFNIFYSEAPAFDSVLKNLVKDTEKHRKIVADKLAELYNK